MRICGKYPDNCASAARNWHHHHPLKMFMCGITAIELNDPSLFGTIKISTSVFYIDLCEVIVNVMSLILPPLVAF